MREPRSLHVAVDVAYAGDQALAAALAFDDWPAETAREEVTQFISDIEPYQPGAFFKRELRCLVAVLARISSPIDTIVIDGYVTLGRDRRPGLGMHLWQTLGEKHAVIGVAKTPFRDTPADCALLRGGSSRPLFVTAAGIEQAEAKRLVASMHGAFRTPTLLKRVDRLSRSVSIDALADIPK